MPLQENAVRGPDRPEPRRALAGLRGRLTDPTIGPLCREPLSRPGPYTAVLHSQGAAVLRLPLQFNGLMEGLSTAAPRALALYQSPAFILRPAGNLFLILFFLASVAATWLARRSPSTRRRRA